MYTSITNACENSLYRSISLSSLFILKESHWQGKHILTLPERGFIFLVEQIENEMVIVLEIYCAIVIRTIWSLE